MWAFGWQARRSANWDPPPTGIFEDEVGFGVGNSDNDGYDVIHRIAADVSVR